ncbi:hypothetical protein [Halogeometricum limi]|uniref:Uncharacterized protein n=1 Tax=Halogeometricum limi TaxID=555875 RepID=A0A1I6HA15_9EURY|nr:hypothetical protein [Halogeometricum limi]SFR51190.1 hypothetical protein SAMN04488124_1959 [Halogeometricum limi]
MNRRELLAVAGAVGLGATSGCLGYTVVEADAVTDRRVRIAELEAKLAAREEQIAELEADVDALRSRVAGPEVNLVRAVTDWSRVGDVVTEQTDRVAGETLTAAVNYDYPVHPGAGGSGEADADVTVELARDGATVREATTRVRLTLDRDQTLAENALELDVSGVDEGAYALRARVTDNVTGRASPRAETTVELGAE